MSMTISSGDMMDMFKAMSKEMKAQKKVAPKAYIAQYGAPISGGLNEQNLFPILDKFGDERVRGMYDALVDYKPGDWGGCAIARAFGSYGDLVEAAHKAGEDITKFVTHYFHLTPMEVNFIVGNYDNHGNHSKFKKLIELYIEKKKREGTVAVEVYIDKKENSHTLTTKPTEADATNTESEPNVRADESSDKATARVPAKVR